MWANGRHIHDFIAEGEEFRRREGLREEVSTVLGRVHVGHGDLLVLNQLADEEVTAMNVFGPRGFLYT